MSTRRRKQQGFTLVEILIVVVILGILAAIVIPQFTSASEAARGSSMVTQLASIRSQLELAQIQHGGIYPDLSTNWNFMTQATQPASTVGGTYTAGTGNGDVGPYLQNPPVNPFENSTTVVNTATPAAGDGWNYNQATGVITAVVEGTKATSLGLNTQDYTPY